MKQVARGTHNKKKGPVVERSGKDACNSSHPLYSLLYSLQTHLTTQNTGLTLLAMYGTTKTRKTTVGAISTASEPMPDFQLGPVTQYPQQKNLCTAWIQKRGQGRKSTFMLLPELLDLKSATQHHYYFTLAEALETLAGCRC